MKQQKVTTSRRAAIYEEKQLGDQGTGLGLRRSSFSHPLNHQNTLGGFGAETLSVANVQCYFKDKMGEEESLCSLEETQARNAANITI